MSYLLAPSVLSADFANLQRDVEMINKSKADWFHVDVMDGVFVPNISLGFPVIKALKKHAKKPLDVHLMIVHPEKYLSQFKEAGADILTVHLEACTHLHRTVQEIKALGMQAGVAINPHSPVAGLSEIISEIDVVCVMSVNPGFGGQKFIRNTFTKISELKTLILQKQSSAKIEIDGGVDLLNYKQLIQQGADILVAGNTVFTSPSPIETIELLKQV
ncbi:MAG: ribulose-phosphate 3-epimerase [Bacteroidetes bacterium]|nr:ribulose-phosphate 3-epimerase [Bacteroidota bacterium]MBK9673077.1 ribulose-phosphate 3-epimerase [Bacteroidota bacterium]MBK9799631.1 ribulose-phosphate 3-epimerase [Bacteroidota bacterium]MBP6412354.1 ribulose-phosphate 3-epimerase [Bacteroidia bacterium]